MAARTVLRPAGFGSDAIHDELFFAGPLDVSSLAPEPAEQTGTVELSVILDGRSTTTRMLPGDVGSRCRSAGPGGAALLVQGRDVCFLQGEGRRGRGADGKELGPGRL